MERRRFAILRFFGAISLLICVLLTMFWIRTWFGDDRSMLLATGGRLYGVSTHDGGLFAVWRYDILPANLPLQSIAGPLEYRPIPLVSAGPGKPGIILTDDGKLLEIPLVPLIPLFAAGPLILLTISRRERRKIARDRRIKGLCQECAYDLTGNTSGVCPECGAHRHRIRRRYTVGNISKK